VEKKKELYVSLQLIKCLSANASFNLWMFKRAHDIFTLVVNFLNVNWQPKQVTIGLFEAIETTRQALAINLNNLLDSFGLKKKIIAFVKEEGVNLNAMTSIARSIVNCFNGNCFGHVLSKGCQYGIIEEKVCKNMKFVSIKNAQFDIQKCITWLKKSGKGKQKWNKVCMDAGIQPKKLNTLLKTRLVFLCKLSFTFNLSYIFII
jgi:hypothetical protein